MTVLLVGAFYALAPLAAGALLGWAWHLIGEELDEHRKGRP